MVAITSLFALCHFLAVGLGLPGSSTASNAVGYQAAQPSDPVPHPRTGGGIAPRQGPFTPLLRPFLRRLIGGLFQKTISRQETFAEKLYEFEAEIGHVSDILGRVEGIVEQIQEARANKDPKEVMRLNGERRELQEELDGVVARKEIQGVKHLEDLAAREQVLHKEIDCAGQFEMLNELYQANMVDNLAVYLFEEKKRDSKALLRAAYEKLGEAGEFDRDPSELDFDLFDKKYVRKMEVDCMGTAVLGMVHGWAITPEGSEDHMD